MPHHATTIAALLCAAHAAHAGLIEITTDAAIADGDLSLDGEDIAVIGATLTIDGEHTFASLSITGGGVVTHSPAFSNGAVNGVALTITGDLFVEAGSSINADAKGFAQGEGPGAGGEGFDPGGAGHAGAGGDGFTVGDQGGDAYGSITEPADLGSGGGFNASCVGGSEGGGAVRLIIDGVATIDGEISADGAGGIDCGSADNAGGAGGSIWIDAASITGAGVVTANGGLGQDNNGGGGGGGRLAVYAAAGALPEANLQTLGGPGFVQGGSGTIYLQTGADPGVMIIDAGGADAPSRDVTEFAGEHDLPFDVVVRNGGRIGPRHAQPMHLVIGGDCTIAADGEVMADARGFPQAQGPGVGGAAFDPGGGGHAGAGGDGLTAGDQGGAAYGSITEPADLGSGGGDNASCPPSFALGSEGGGAVRLTIAGHLAMDGLITADGAVGRDCGSADNAGGAGGSVWIDADSIAGAGAITANGGLGQDVNGGGGGGGRVAVHAGAGAFDPANIQALGGPGFVQGGSGTVFVRFGQDPGLLIIDAAGADAATRDVTEFAGEHHLPFSVLVRNGGRIGPPHGQPMHLIVDGDFTIEATGEIDADGRGFTQGLGPGAGAEAFDSGGAAHAGAGGDAIAAAGQGGDAYGDITQPTTLGSGGGANASCVAGFGEGGEGGGAVRFTVGGLFTNDGLINVNGRRGRDCGSADNGGGAGGSVWIDAAAIAGAGSVTADGGVGEDVNAGGGGGGRIAVYAGASTFADDGYRAFGGAGFVRGGAGTIFLQDGAEGGPLGTLIINAGGASEPTREITELAGDQDLPFNVVVRNGGRLGPPPGEAVHFMVGGDVMVEETGSIYALGRGFGQGEGPGVGGEGFDSAGAGHGGKGGDGFGGPVGGDAYGQLTTPTTLGSGGGANAACTLASRGGGALRLTVAGALTIDGAIDADGEPGGDCGSADNGGGAGGAIWIAAAAIDGDGLISARGGSGADNNGGGGGGGRIAIDLASCDDLLAPAGAGIFDASGGDGFQPGDDGALFGFFVPADLNADLVVDSADLNILLSVFGRGGGTRADIDEDGVVGSSDLNILLADFGDGCL